MVWDELLARPGSWEAKPAASLPGTLMRQQQGMGLTRSHEEKDKLVLSGRWLGCAPCAHPCAEPHVQEEAPT